MMIKKIILTILFLPIIFSHSFAEEIGFELKLEKNKVPPGKQVYLEAVFPANKDISIPEIPFIEGLDIRYARTDKESPAGVLKYIYRIAVMKEGVFKIGPVEFDHGGDRYISNTVYLSVERIELPAPGDAGQTGASFDISKHIFLVLDSPKSNVFVNEKVPVVLRLYSDWLDVENIVFSQKPRENLIAKKFDDRTVNTIEKGGIKYVVLEYRSYIYAATPGQYDLEPIDVKFDVAKVKPPSGGSPAETLNQNIQEYDEFIGQGSSRTVELSTKPFSVTVAALPQPEQPESFTGAVGNFTFNMTADPTSVKEGDTVGIKISIGGEGNFDTVGMPKIVEVEGLRVYEPKSVRDKNSVSFDLEARVLSYDVREIPAVTFSFFNPDAAEYRSITKGPIPITIQGEPDRKRSALEGEAKKTVEINIVGLKSLPGRLSRSNMYYYRSKLFASLAVFPILLIIASLVIEKRIKFLSDNPDYAALITSARKARYGLVRSQRLINPGDHKPFYGAVFDTLQQYLGGRSLIPSAGVTAIVLDELSRFEIDPEVLRRVKNIFSECYLARYTSATFTKEEMQKTMEEMRYVINELNKKRFCK